MTRPHHLPRRRASAVTIALLLAASALALGGAAHADPRPSPSLERSDLSDAGWSWPLQEFRVERPFVAPPHRYGPGHRGIDLRPLGAPSVRAPAAGVVAFAGEVAGRPLLTIDHGDGLVTTLEPLESELVAGTPVARDEPVGRVALGGHVDPGTVHFGVRRHGEYINPLLLLGGVPRAVLLPCC